MITNQFSVYYRCQSTGEYRKVASIWTAGGESALGSVLAVMNGGPATPGMRVRYFFNPLSLRPMGQYDLVEYDGKACYWSDEHLDWVYVYASKEHNYTWVKPDLAREQAEREAEYKDWAEEQYAINNCLV